MDRYITPDQATIFNFKNIYNKLAKDLNYVNGKNILTNPNFSELHYDHAFGWVIHAGNLITPLSVEYIESQDFAQMYFTSGDDFISQTIDKNRFKLDTEYTLVFDAQIDPLSKPGEYSIDITAGQNDIIASNIGDQITDYSIRRFLSSNSETHIIRFKTRSSRSSITDRFGEDFEIKINRHDITDMTDSYINVKNFVLTEGNLALISAHYDELDQKIRWNNTENCWEITVDNYSTWERLMLDDQYLHDRIEELIEAQMLSAVRQSNIFAGSNIDIHYGSIDDGEGHIIPTLTISSSGIGGSGGTGDWTREDMIYQAMLEQSDFSYASYNTFMEEENVTFTGGAYYDDSEDDTGAGKVIGYVTDAFVVDDLVTEKGVDHFSFYVHAETNLGVDAREVVDLEYDASADGVVWTGWTACGLKEYVTTNDVFKYLKLRFTFKGVGQRNITSYGLMYGYDQLSGNASNGFLEIHQVTAVDEAAIEATIALPNGRWYHKDGKSLEVFYDGNRLLVGVDYEEVNVGFTDKSNAVRFFVDLIEDKYIVFKEIYGKTSTTSLASTQPWMSVTSHYSANTFNKILVDTTLNPITVTIPQNPNVGDEIQIADMKGTFAINNLTLHSNNHVIQNSYYDFIINDNLAHITLVFVNATVGWRVYHYYSFTK